MLSFLTGLYNSACAMAQPLPVNGPAKVIAPAWSDSPLYANFPAADRAETIAIINQWRQSHYHRRFQWPSPNFRNRRIYPGPIFASTDGTVWRAFTGYIVGFPTDLWITSSSHGESWSIPLYTGLRHGYFLPGKNLPRIAVRGGRIWLTYLPWAGPDKPQIGPHEQILPRTVVLSLWNLTRDTDRDGLPDLLEKLLGTNAHKADTDGDGIPDGSDLNPLAAPSSATSDDQGIFQAVFEIEAQGVDTAINVGGVSPPQEFYGASVPVLPLGASGDSLAAPISIVFRKPRDIPNARLPSGFTGGTICFNAARDEALVDIDVGTLWGGTGSRCHLRKIAGSWYVFEIQPFHFRQS